VGFLSTRHPGHQKGLGVGAPDPVCQKAATDYIFEGLKSGVFKTQVTKTFRFDDIVEAHRELEKNQHLGRMVVNVQDSGLCRLGELRISGRKIEVFATS
jgi:NADPH:quinone reductase-like Zn-dependent oxidoreductase